MSALSKQAGSPGTMRLRKVWCPDCGYAVRMARSWIAVGVPACPNGACVSHGQPMVCADPVDAVEAGHLELDQLGSARTAVCRRAGWEDEIIRRSPGRKSRGRQCKHVGCSRFVAKGELFCHEHSAADTPF